MKSRTRCDIISGKIIGRQREKTLWKTGRSERLANFTPATVKSNGRIIFARFAARLLLRGVGLKGKSTKRLRWMNV